MASDDNIPEMDENVRGTWPVIGTRAHPDDRKLIDQAALELGMKRGPFMLEAALDRARAVLLARRATDTPPSLVGR